MHADVGYATDNGHRAKDARRLISAISDIGHFVSAVCYFALRLGLRWRLAHGKTCGVSGRHDRAAAVS